MKLSVCLITRNEASRLAAAIESVRAVADEVIVNDTGSTDGTIELARTGPTISPRLETPANRTPAATGSSGSTATSA